MRNPAPTRSNDALIWSSSVPSLMSSSVPVTTCHGLGKMALSLRTTTIHQSPMRIDISATGGRTFFRFSMKRLAILLQPFNPLQNLLRAPTQSSPGRRERLLDDDRHLTARVRGARKLVLRSALEGQPEALARHHQRRAEDLWDVVAIPQHENVACAGDQADLLGQDLDLLSGHPSRPGSFRNFEQFLP